MLVFLSFNRIANSRLSSMEKPTSYCQFIDSLEEDHVHRIYHDQHYGFPIESDDELFCRLVLEINQAGLSWTTILNKQDNFRKAYSNFSIQEVAQYGDADVERLLQDAGIIRNKLKVHAAIYNANQICALQESFGSFQHWLAHHHPLPLQDWVKLFKKTFKFTGGEITNEFLMSTGYLQGAHIATCSIYPNVLNASPRWNEV
jgi:DNA-3-methyladenine glycosylase I